MNWLSNLPSGRPWLNSRAGQLCYNAWITAISLFCSNSVSMTQPSPSTVRNVRPRRGGWVSGVLLAAFVLTVGFSAYLIFTTVRDFVLSWKWTDNPGPGVSLNQPTSAANANIAPPTKTPPPIIPQKWSGTERVTVLLMGIDYRQGADCENQGTAYRTDTMMLATLDPVGMTAGLLSIPRDLWVEIPGYENDTINTANFRGDAYSYPGGGPALAVKTVEANFGVNVDYYVRMDFTAFEKVIDLIGGIDINNAEDINDPEYPDSACGFEPFVLSAGPHHLGGHDALRYARTRHNSTDIARGERQREVALAVLKRVKDPALLPTLLSQAPGLYQALNENVRTNLTLDQIGALGMLAKDIPLDKVRQEGITYEYVQEYVTPEGRQVLMPWWDKIRALRDSFFTSTALSPHATFVPDDPAKLASEAAKVQVLNGAGVQGLAQTTANWLTKQGLNVVSYDTADRIDYTQSVIVDFTGKAYTVRWLAKVFNVPQASIRSGADPNSPIDVQVILGHDWTVPAAGAP